jgi:hypothetical protein
MMMASTIMAIASIDSFHARGESAILEVNRFS